MAKRKTIFGFGSLIGTSSLLATAPGAADIRPAYIVGFRRHFSKWDATGYTETHLDLAGQPMCALDVVLEPGSVQRINGVTFSVNEADYAALLLREEGYQVISTPAYDYQTGDLITEDCLVFSANTNDGKYMFDGLAQRQYLLDIIASARAYGDAYLREILSTTFIDDRCLHDIPEIVALLE